MAMFLVFVLGFLVGVSVMMAMAGCVYRNKNN